MLKNKKIIISISLCLLLLIGLIAVLNNYSARNQAKREELEAVYESLYEQAMLEIEENEKKREEELKERAEKEATYSPYEKLGEKGMITYVLYLGDRTANGKGLKDRNESFILLLRDKYDEFQGKSDRLAGTQSIEKPDGGTLAFLNRQIDIYISTSKLDLLFLCAGTHGQEEDFGKEYEKIVLKAKNHNKNSDVICIIEHDQSDEEAEAIIRISEHYELLCVDMRSPFESSQETLLFEDGEPNEQGHQLYADEIFKVLKKAVEEKRGTKELKTTGVFLTSEEFFGITGAKDGNNAN